MSRSGPDRSPAVAPPPGQGGTVATYQPGRRGVLGAFVLCLLIGTALLGLRGALTDGRAVPGLLVVVGLSLVVVALGGRTQLAAGAGWLSNRSLVTRRWIRTDDVVDVTESNSIGGLKLRLRDSQGRTVYASTGDLVADARLLGQVRTDLRTSVSRGLVVPDRTRQALGLDRTGKR